MQDRNGNPNKKNSLKKNIGGWGGGQSRSGQDFLSAQMMRAFCEVWKTKGDQNNMKAVWSKRAPVSVYSLSLSCSWLFSFLQATLCCRQVQFLCLAVGYFPVFTPHFVSAGAVPLFCSWLFSFFRPCFVSTGAVSLSCSWLFSCLHTTLCCRQVQFLQDTVRSECEERFELTEALGEARRQLLALKKPNGMK